MFTGFKLEIDKTSFEKEILTDKNFDYYKEIGERHLSIKRTQCENDLKDYIFKGIIDGTKLQDDWFPQITGIDIFISHSHKDKDLALALAGWLHEKFNLECFIDSCVWGYVNDLLKLVNDRYSNKRSDGNGGFLYSHEKCNNASCHVNMMLNIALQKVIDSTETVILINTSNSIKKYDENTSTFSPWIYSEVVCTEIIRRKELLEYRKYKSKILLEKFSNESKELKVEYNISLEHLKDLDYSILKKWESNCNLYKSIFNYPLDQLYILTSPKEFKKFKELNYKFLFEACIDNIEI